MHYYLYGVWWWFMSLPYLPKMEYESDKHDAFTADIGEAVVT